MGSEVRYHYPRRRALRWVLRLMSRPAFGLLTNLEIEGRENLPSEGPFLVVGNHFSFIDPAAIVRIARWPMEFLGGAEFPHAPAIVNFIPRMWGYYPLFRGTGSRDSLKVAEAILRQGGVLGIFPEGGNWAEVLRPARPGTAYLAVRTGVPLIPVGLFGFTQVFPFKPGCRAKVHIRIGKPFGPYEITGRGRERRERLDQIGHEIMQQIANLLPQELRGHYSDDPEIRAAAKGTEIYPWADKVEGEVEGTVR